MHSGKKLALIILVQRLQSIIAYVVCCLAFIKISLSKVNIFIIFITFLSGKFSMLMSS